MPWPELPWTLLRMTNGMISWDVTDIEAYINITVPISWAPLDIYLVLYGIKNFKWTQRFSYHGPRGPCFTLCRKQLPLHSGSHPALTAKWLVLTVASSSPHSNGGIHK